MESVYLNSSEPECEFSFWIDRLTPQAGFELSESNLGDIESEGALLVAPF